MRKVLSVSMLAGVLAMPLMIMAQNDFEVIPKAGNETTVSEAVGTVGKEGGSVWTNYNAVAKNLENLGGQKAVGAQLASGIMTWDTLLNYIVYLVRFISQIGIFAGVMMIIYAGYLYATSIFNPSNMNKGKSAITNAIIGVLVIAFSYAIMKLLTSAFIE